MTMAAMTCDFTADAETIYKYVGNLAVTSSRTRPFRRSCQSTDSGKRRDAADTHWGSLPYIATWSRPLRWSRYRCRRHYVQKDAITDSPSSITSQDSWRSQALGHPLLLLDSINWIGVPNLHDAVMEGSLSAVCDLISEGASVNCRDTSKDAATALQRAVIAGEVIVVAALLLAGASVSVKTAPIEGGNSMLHIAASTGHVETLEILLHTVKTLGKFHLVDAVNVHGETALMLAVKAGHVEATSLLLVVGSNPNTRAFSGNKTALHEALSRGHFCVVHSLLRHAGVITLTIPEMASDYLRDLRKRFQAGLVEEIDQAHRMRVTGTQKMAPSTSPVVVAAHHCMIVNKLNIHDAVRWESAVAVDDLLRNRESAKYAKDAFGRSVLHVAALRGACNVVTVLLECGCSVNDLEYLRGQTPLHWAASQGHCDVMKELVKHGAYVDQSDEGIGRQTPLHMAAQFGHSGAVDILLESGASIDQKETHFGRTALHLAVTGDFASVVRVLLDCGASTRKKDHQDQTALRWAVRNGKANVLEVFLAHDATKTNCNVASHEAGDAHHSNSQGTTLLHEAVSVGCRAMVSMLLLAGSEVDATDCLGRSPLHWVTTSVAPEHVVIAQELLEHGAATTCTQDAEGNTPLLQSVTRGNINMVRVLLESSPSPSSDQEENLVMSLRTAVSLKREGIVSLLVASGASTRELLLEATRRDDVEVVHMLLKGIVRLPNVDAISEVRSLLLVAVRSQKIGVVQLLLEEYKASPHVSDDSGVPLLLVCAKAGSTKALKMLLGAGADIRDSDGEGNTSLIVAAKCGHTNVISALLEKDPYTRHTNLRGHSALFFAVEQDDIDSVWVLLQYGALVTVGFPNCGSAIYLCARLDYVELLKVILTFDRDLIDVKGSFGQRPLETAVKVQDAKAVSLLLERGASVDLRYKAGKTILHMSVAAECVNHAIVRDLISYGAHVGRRDASMMSSLHLSARAGDSQTTGMLIEACGSDPVALNAKRITDGKSPFLVAVASGSIKAVDLLLQHGVNFDAADSNGLNALHVAASNLDHGMVQYLLKYSKSDDDLRVAFNAQPCMPSAPPPPASLESDPNAKARAKAHNMFVNAQDCYGSTPLHKASVIGECSMVFILLEGGANGNAVDGRGTTPLHNATDKGSHETAAALLSKRASTSIQRSGDGHNVLHLAVQRGDFFFTKLILEHGTDTERALAQHEYFELRTPLHIAVQKNRTDLVTILLEHKAPVDMLISAGGPSALGIAASQSSVDGVEMTKLLLDNGASTGSGGEMGLTPLYLAAEAGNAVCVKLLLGREAVPGHCWNSFGVTPLFPACREGHLDAVKMLLPLLTTRQIDRHCKATGSTALIVAIEEGHKDVVKMLLMYGANPNQADRRGGKLPLAIAAAKYSTAHSASIVRCLLRHGADPGLFNGQGMLSIHAACDIPGGDDAVVKALLENPNTSVNRPCPGRDFQLPLHMAASKGHHMAAIALVSTQGCLLEEKETKHRRTALGIAVSNGHTETVRVLLEAGANLHASAYDNKGKLLPSLVHEAAVRGCQYICRLLLQAMAIMHHVKIVEDSLD